MKRFTLLSALFVSGCGYNWAPGGDSVSLQHLRRHAPLWTAAVEGRAAAGLAECLAAALQGPGDARLIRVAGTAYITHNPFYQGAEDFELSIRDLGPEQKIVEMRHHASDSLLPELKPQLEEDLERVKLAVRTCGDA